MTAHWYRCPPCRADNHHDCSGPAFCSCACSESLIASPEPPSGLAIRDAVAAGKLPDIPNTKGDNQ